MQRLLSLATLAVMGGLGWMFLQGGGLGQIALPRGSQSQHVGYQQGDSYQTPGPWQVSPTSSYPAGAYSQPTRDSQDQQSYQSPWATRRPSVSPSNTSDRQTIRIASFNIQVFGNSKSSKPYVMRELADIVNQFDVIAIQEIRSQNEYLIPNFVRLVNQYGTQLGRRFDYVIGPRLGVTTSKEQYVYLFDAGRVEVDRQSVFTVSDPDGLLHREPLVATFRARGVNPDQAFTFTLINMHTDPDIAQQEMDVLADVYRVVRRSSRGEDDIILLGDFNVDDRHLGRLSELPGMMPLIVGVWTNTRQNRQYDNLIIHQPSTTEYVGNSGVFDFMRFKNLSLQQALQVSDHFPVWAEFSIYERDLDGRIATRRR